MDHVREFLAVLGYHGATDIGDGVGLGLMALFPALLPTYIS